MYLLQLDWLALINNWIHSSCYFCEYHLNLKHGVASRICAEESPMSGNGVLQCWSIARAAFSLFKLPSADILLWIIRFADLTTVSARPLDCGYETDESLCLTHQSFKNCWKLSAINWGPPSLLNSSETPYAANKYLKMFWSLILFTSWAPIE